MADTKTDAHPSIFLREKAGGGQRAWVMQVKWDVIAE